MVKLVLIHILNFLFAPIIRCLAHQHLLILLLLYDNQTLDLALLLHIDFIDVV